MKESFILKHIKPKKSLTRKLPSRIALRLFLSTVAISIVISIITSSVQLYRNFKNDLGEIDRSLSLIENSFLPSISKSAYRVDREQLQTQLKGILLFRGVQYLKVTLTTSQKDFFLEEGTPQRRADLVRRYPLLHWQSLSSAIKVGELLVEVSQKSAYQNLRKNAVLTFASTFIQIILVTFAILLLVRYHIVRHLISLAKFTRRMNIDNLDTPLVLNRPSGSKGDPDELDYVVSAINDLRESLSEEFQLQKESELKVLKEKSFSDALIRVFPDLFFLCDENLNLVRWNEALEIMTGKNFDELIGSNIVDWIDQSERKDFHQLRSEVYKRKTAFGEISLLNWEQEKIPYLISASLVELDHRQYIVGIGLDITQQKETQTELENYRAHLEDLVDERTREANTARETAETANKSKSIFLANISHELRTPLNVILGYSRLISRDTALPIDHQKKLEIIIRSGNHLLDMINDVLELTRIESGYAKLKISDFNLIEMLQTLESSFTLRASEKGLNLVFDIATAIPVAIRSDEAKLRQILFNLLSNAVKFTDKGEVSVIVSYYAEADGAPRCVFEVKDTGFGIAPNEMDNLFIAFEQTEAGKRSKEGTGLGLGIVQDFAKMMQGEITVESTVGVGSTFKLVLPVEAAEDQVIYKKKSGRKVKKLKAGQSFRILIVDDIKENRDLLSNFIKDVGFEVETAEDGDDALEAYGNWNPHMVFMDIKMPKMNGDIAARIIKKTYGETAAPVIAVTASVFEEDREQILFSGCDAFIRKPFHEDEIFETLTRFINAEFDDAEESVKEPSFTDLSIERIKKVTKSSLSHLPDDLYIELKDVSLQLNSKLLKATASKIKSNGQKDLATGLEEIADTLKFDVLINLFSADQVES